jgi:hypothetical protein
MTVGYWPVAQPGRELAREPRDEFRLWGVGARNRRGESSRCAQRVAILVLGLKSRRPSPFQQGVDERGDQVRRISHGNF